jgi:hypothetical protein
MSSKAMTIDGRAVLVTGANRGIGLALVEARRRQPLRHVRSDPGPPATPDSFSGSPRRQRVDDGPRPLPLTPAYAISKAAAFNLSNRCAPFWPDGA